MCILSFTTVTVNNYSQTFVLYNHCKYDILHTFVFVHLMLTYCMQLETFTVKSNRVEYLHSLSMKFDILFTLHFLLFIRSAFNSF